MLNGGQELTQLLCPPCDDRWLPACLRCGRPGEIPVRPHGVALCGDCYAGALRGEPAAV